MVASDVANAGFRLRERDSLSFISPYRLSVDPIAVLFFSLPFSSSRISRITILCQVHTHFSSQSRIHYPRLPFVPLQHDPPLATDPPAPRLRTTPGPRHAQTHPPRRPSPRLLRRRQNPRRPPAPIARRHARAAHGAHAAARADDPDWPSGLREQRRELADVGVVECERRWKWKCEAVV
ncbi:hypothetical protein A0H81_04593 [Grifola frondosa]|uniref:Uncharacterized protein n=1 Tax=Grifola frondosa TaxID=5627 RepID=A0A1C7MER1_GRIFR|nr:hypothetical protein A0H81_04593 [Grifola frondosa]